MEVKSGYIQTDIGLLPEDWDVIQLADVFTFKNGLNKEKQFFGKGIPIVNYMDVYKNSGIVESDIAGRVTLSQQEIKNYEVRKGDVFFTRTSETIEEIGLSTVVLSNVKDTVFSGFVLRARPKNERLALQYKKYCFSTNQVRKEITSKSSYTTRALTNGKLLSNVKIAIPKSTSEQIAIATALSDADATISSLEKLIAKKRNIKQGAMQQLLQPKEGWKIKKLGDVGECLRGVSYNPASDLFENDTTHSVRLFRSNNVQNNLIDLNGLQYVHRSKVKEMQFLRSNDIVICMANGSKHLVGKSAIFIKPDTNDYTFGAFMGCFRTYDALADSKFISLIFLTHTYRTYIDVLLSGSSINNLRPSDIESIKISIPEKPEQEKIAGVIAEMDSEIAVLEIKLKKYKQIKQGMMQQLLTGKIRLV